MTQATPTISVLVPCYDVEPFLRQCLDSILAQTFGDFEVLLVNDGSTDGTLAILREYESTDPRFLVIDKANAGYGAAVNTALDRAAGTWIAIVEPDDYLPADAFSKLLAGSQVGSEVDIVKGSFRDFFDDLPAKPRYVVPPLEGHMPKTVRAFAVSDFPEVLFHHPSIWSCLYRRAFLAEHGIRMVEARGAGWTDNPWLLETFLRSRECVWVPDVCYFYRQKESVDSRRVANPSVPFDRLREMRAIIDRTGFGGKPEIEAAHAKRVFAYVGLVIDKWGFPEKDPSIRALVNEAIAGVEPKVVMASRRLPAAARIHFRDLTGQLLAETPGRAASDSPKVSVLLLTCNDRRTLWPTIRSLTRQTMRDFEVICIDDDSQDRTQEILRAVAAKDRRFTLIEAKGDAAVPIGIARARGRWLFGIRPGQSLPSIGWLRALVRECSRHSNAEILTMRPAPYSRLSGCNATTYVMRRDLLDSEHVPHRFFADDGVGLVLGGLRTSRRTERIGIEPVGALARWRLVSWRTANSAEAVADIERRCDAISQAPADKLPAAFAALSTAREIRDGFKACGLPLRREKYFDGLSKLADREDARLCQAAVIDQDVARIRDEIAAIRSRGYDSWAAERIGLRELSLASTPRYFSPRRIARRLQKLGRI